MGDPRNIEVKCSMEKDCMIKARNPELCLGNLQTCTEYVAERERTDYLNRIIAKAHGK